MKRAIGDLRGLPPAVQKPLEAIKQNLEDVVGQTPGKQKIQKLGPTATTADVANKLNELIDRLQE